MHAVSLAEPEVAVEPWLEALRLKGIRVPRPAEVRAYVNRFPDIVPVARQACDLVVTEFAGKAKFSLEVYVDPEIDDDYLMLYVQAGGYDAAINQALESIFAIYSEDMTDGTGWMMVMQDFR
jgi:hypothetical protein